jgi:hypothetical protein
MGRTWQINRRTLLRGAGASLALPWLEAMAAIDTPAPMRLAYLYFPNGVADGAWKPKAVDATGRIKALNAEMAALSPFMSQLTIPARLWTPRGNGHGAGTATWLTGGEYNERTVDAGGMSVDQLAAQHIGSDTLLPTLTMTLKGEGNFAGELSRNNISWVRRGLPTGNEFEPRAIFDRMFRGGQGNWADASVLDLVSDQAKDLQRRLSLADRRKLDEYLSSVRSIEKAIAFAESDSGARIRDRAATDTLARPAPGVPSEHGEYARIMLELLAMALWTGATRIATFMLDHGQSNRYFNFIDGVQGTWHALSHYRDISGRTEDDDGKTKWKSRASKREMYNAVTRWHHEQLAYLLRRLTTLQTARGSLLDNTLLLYGSSIADGHEHAAENLPLIVAGGGSKLRLGRYLEPRGQTSMSRLHLALLQQAGVPITRFAETKTPFSDLLT